MSHACRRSHHTRLERSRAHAEQASIAPRARCAQAATREDAALAARDAAVGARQRAGDVAGLAHVVRRALEFEPARRPTMAELAAHEWLRVSA